MFGCFSYATTEYGSIQTQGTVDLARIFSRYSTILQTVQDRHILATKIDSHSVIHQGRQDKNVVELKSNKPHVLGTKSSMHITQ